MLNEQWGMDGEKLARKQSLKKNEVGKIDLDMAGAGSGVLTQMRNVVFMVLEHMESHQKL